MFVIQITFKASTKWLKLIFRKGCVCFTVKKRLQFISCNSIFCSFIWNFWTTTPFLQLQTVNGKICDASSVIYLSFLVSYLQDVRAGTAQSVYRFAKGWTVRGSNPGGCEISAPVQNGSRAHPFSYTMGTGSFLWVKRPGRGVDHPSHPAPMLKKE